MLVSQLYSRLSADELRLFFRRNDVLKGEISNIFGYYL